MRKVSTYAIFVIGLIIFLGGQIGISMHWWGYGNVMRISGGIIALSAFIFANLNFDDPKDRS